MTKELDDLSEFEELEAEVSNDSQKSQQSQPRKPDMRVVQPVVGQDGKQIYRSVGGMWKSVSKNGNVFYVLRIGELRLLVFPNKE